MASNQPTGLGALPPMKALSSNTFLYEPPSAAPDPNSPKVIALFGWMSAQDVHIAKYTSRYMALYPTARILVVRCPFIHTLSSRIAKRDIKPAVSVIRALADATPRGESRPQLLLHVFSNGGATNLSKFYELYAAADRAGRIEMPPHVTVYDSCPGGFHWMRSYRALSAALPRILAPFVHVVIAWFWLVHAPAGRLGFFGKMWSALKQKALLYSEQRRVYLYSREDEMIYWGDVEKHASEAKEVGFKVRKERFEGSKHVAHARLDGERYWGTVKELWDGQKEVAAAPEEVKSEEVKPEEVKPEEVKPEESKPKEVKEVKPDLVIPESVKDDAKVDVTPQQMPKEEKKPEPAKPQPRTPEMAKAQPVKPKRSPTPPPTIQ